MTDQVNGTGETVEITMAGRTYMIEELFFGPALEWQREFKEKFGALGDIFQTISQARGKNPKEIMEGLELPTVAGQIARLQNMVFDSLPEAFDLMCKYAPAIEADRQHIMDRGKPSEIVAAFIKMLKVALPAGKLIRVFSGAARGLTKPN